jgi:hypothetical protein
MFIRNLALISQVTAISFNYLLQVGAAIQKQILRDFSPIWKIDATVSVFAKASEIPTGYWPIVIVPQIQSNESGFHMSAQNQPYAAIKFEDGWELSVSHEALEMLVDPSGSLLIASDSLVAEQGRVLYLVEICDPSEDPQFAYTVDAIPVSDFTTPNYFDPVQADGVRYSFTGHIKEPKQVLKGGYLSWFVPTTGEWWQRSFLGERMITEKLGTFGQTTSSLRREVDYRSAMPRSLARQSGLLARCHEFKLRKQLAEAAAISKGASFDAEVKGLIEKNWWKHN